MSQETSERYFMGNTLNGPVKAVAGEAWGDVLNILRLGARLDMTRAEFLALPREERNRIKAVRYFVPACFRTSPSQRTYEQATVCNLIFLDIDDADDARPFSENPGLLYKALWRSHNFAAYHTANSTPENPRLRIVIDAAEGIPKERYAAAVAFMGARLGLRKITRESRIAVQPMYLPTLFSDTREIAC